MLKKFSALLLASLTLMPVQNASAASTDTTVHLLDSQGNGIADVELWVDAGGQV